MDPEFRLARPDDLPSLLRLMRAFYGDTGTPFDAEAASPALAALAADPTLGRVFLIEVGRNRRATPC